MRLTALALVLCLAGCGGSDRAGSSPDDDANALEVTRDDASRVEFAGGVRAWCEDGRVHVLGGRFPKEDEDDPPSFWYVSARDGEETIDLPAENVMFVFDSERGTSGNELSSNEEESDGSVIFDESGCEDGDVVRVEVDATLDSEYHDLPSADAEGEIEAVVGEPVPIPD